MKKIFMLSTLLITGAMIAPSQVFAADEDIREATTETLLTVEEVDKEDEENRELSILKTPTAYDFATKMKSSGVYELEGSFRDSDGVESNSQNIFEVYSNVKTLKWKLQSKAPNTLKLVGGTKTVDVIAMDLITDSGKVDLLAHGTVLENTSDANAPEDGVYATSATGINLSFTGEVSGGESYAGEVIHSLSLTADVE